MRNLLGFTDWIADLKAFQMISNLHGFKFSVRWCGSFCGSNVEANCSAQLADCCCASRFRHLQRKTFDGNCKEIQSGLCVKLCVCSDSPFDWCAHKIEPQLDFEHGVSVAFAGNFCFKQPSADGMRPHLDGHIMNPLNWAPNIWTRFSEHDRPVQGSSRAWVLRPVSIVVIKEKSPLLPPSKRPPNSVSVQTSLYIPRTRFVLTPRYFCIRNPRTRVLVHGFEYFPFYPRCK